MRTKDKLEELMNVQKCLRDNCHTQKFIDQYKKPKENKTGIAMVSKKPMSVNLNFKCDVANIIGRRQPSFYFSINHVQ